MLKVNQTPITSTLYNESNCENTITRICTAIWYSFVVGRARNVVVNVKIQRDIFMLTLDFELNEQFSNSSRVNVIDRGSKNEIEVIVIEFIAYYVFRNLLE